MSQMDVLYPLRGCRTTRIYCRPCCPAGRHMKRENRVRFASRNEAIAQGYPACKICKPDGPVTEPEVFFRNLFDSPLGTYTIVSSKKGIVSVSSPVTTPDRLRRIENKNVTFLKDSDYNLALVKELKEYFKGKVTIFSVPFDLRGTPFQLKVWEELTRIPYGQTSTYGEIARKIKLPLAARAVGQAIHCNPVAIAVPCHRVIGADGSLTGYASGLERKRFLLDLEARASSKSLQ